MGWISWEKKNIRDSVAERKKRGLRDCVCSGGEPLWAYLYKEHAASLDQGKPLYFFFEGATVTWFGSGAVGLCEITRLMHMRLSTRRGAHMAIVQQWLVTHLNLLLMSVPVLEGAIEWSLLSFLNSIWRYFPSLVTYEEFPSTAKPF